MWLLESLLPMMIWKGVSRERRGDVWKGSMLRESSRESIRKWSTRLKRREEKNALDEASFPLQIGCSLRLLQYVIYGPATVDGELIIALVTPKGCSSP